MHHFHPKRSKYPSYVPFKLTASCRRLDGELSVSHQAIRKDTEYRLWAKYILIHIITVLAEISASMRNRIRHVCLHCFNRFVTANQFAQLFKVPPKLS